MKMNERRVKDFTPIHPKKAAFFKSLLTFFESTDDNTLIEDMSAKQRELIKTLDEFATSGTYIPKYDVSDVSVLNAEVVKKMRPTMKGKVALYDALVAFFDATLAVEKEYEEDCDFNNDIEDNFISIALSAMPSFIGASIISPSVKQAYEQKKGEKARQNKKKTYHINVHFDVVVPVKVDAFDEDEALDIAKRYADCNDYEDCFISGACVTDVEE